MRWQASPDRHFFHFLGDAHGAKLVNGKMGQKRRNRAKEKKNKTKGKEFQKSHGRKALLLQNGKKFQKASLSQGAGRKKRNSSKKHGWTKVQEEKWKLIPKNKEETYLLPKNRRHFQKIKKTQVH